MSLILLAALLAGSGLAWALLGAGASPALAPQAPAAPGGPPPVDQKQKGQYQSATFAMG